MEEPSRVERNIRGVLKAMLAMGAFADERYALYIGDFFKAYLQAPRPIDPPPLPDAAGTAGLGPSGDDGWCRRWQMTSSDGGTGCHRGRGEGRRGGVGEAGSGAMWLARTQQREGEE